MSQADPANILPHSSDKESAESERVVIPLIAEQLTVGKRIVETERLRVHKSIEEREEIVDIPLLHEELTVQTVPINREIEGEVPAVRQEGDTLIVPVLKETLVVKKIMMLVEEVHIRRERRTVHEPQTVTLRREIAQIERTEEGQTDNPLAPTLPTEALNTPVDHKELK